MPLPDRRMLTDHEAADYCGFKSVEGFKAHIPVAPRKFGTQAVRYDRLAAEIPPTLTQLLRVDGLGPKRVKAIYDTLGVTTLEELQQAAQKRELRKLPGMGATSEAKLLKAIESLARQTRCEEGQRRLGGA